MKTTKLLAALLSLCLMITLFTSCGSGGKKAEYKAAENAYNNLVDAQELCVEVMHSIYNAWYFSIYEAGDYDIKNAQSCLEDFCSKANLNYNEAMDALNSILNLSDSTDEDFRTGLQWAALQSFNTTISIVVKVYQDNGTFDKIDSNMATAKAALKEVTDKYSDYTGYPTLKSYYSEISAYLEFCKSPTGSFQQLKTTIDNYETNLRNYKNDLSFIFD